MSRTYNAETLMPRALFRQLQECCGGMTIYIPRPSDHAPNLRLKVLDLYSQGFRPAEIARRLCITPRYVYKILKYDRERAQGLGLKK